MTQQHPELESEQAYVDFAYDCLEATKSSAWRLRDLNEPGLGGTMQARFERNAFDEALVKRLNELDLGEAALVFGRIDRRAEQPSGMESFHIGRLAIADQNSEPVVVDWRAPVAEPFYRATGREPMGLLRRRHFAVEGRSILGIEDELFGEGHLGIGHDEGLAGDDSPSTGLRGYSTLLAALVARPHRHARRHRRHDPGEDEDEIIRSPHAGVLVVQGGPGTGKTVVALHRAAYLLYTHRFPLEDQGVLVIGPNRVFLRYIERVLPSLGEAGVEQAMLADLVPDVRFATAGDGAHETTATRRIKGDARMSTVIDRAVADRERPLARTSSSRSAPDTCASRSRCSASSRRQPVVSAGTTQDGATSRVSSSPPWPPRRGWETSRGQNCARTCEACPRSVLRWSGCGRCSPRPSCSTTSSAHGR